MTTGADHPATGPFTLREGTGGAAGPGGGLVAGRGGFGDGRDAGVDGRSVGAGDGSGRVVGLVEGVDAAVGVGDGAGLGARGSGDGADVGRGDGRGVLAGKVTALTATVGAAADTGAGSGEDATRTTRNPTTGIASAVAVAIRIRPGRCTMPPTFSARPDAAACGSYARDRVGSNSRHVQRG